MGHNLIGCEKAGRWEKYYLLILIMAVSDRISIRIIEMVVHFTIAAVTTAMVTFHRAIILCTRRSTGTHATAAKC